MVILISNVVQSCIDKSKTDDSKINDSINKSELVHSDTINKTDPSGFKQGAWFIMDYSRSNIPIPVESGNYTDNRKQGLWHYYDSAGKIVRSIEYKDDFPLK
jgi:hypothetical protein